jgi:DNA polymerase
MAKKKILHNLNLFKSFGIEYMEPITFDKKISSNENLPNSAEHLSNYIEHCNLCELSKLTQKKIIGYGDQTSDLYIVGLSCDFQNDKISSILKTIIEEILELKIQNIYMTNLIKCAIPPSNSTNKNNIDLCKEYFIKQIDIIRPKYIVALGGVPNYLIKNENENSYIYGNCYNYNGLNLIPMLDLEFVSKNPSYKDELYKDFKKLKILMG